MPMLLVNREAKVGIVGGERVGKSALLERLLHNKFDEAYRPTFEEFYPWRDPKTDTDITLCDTAGAPAFDRLRPFSYDGISRFLMCFAVNERRGFRELEEKWLPEIRYFSAGCTFAVAALKTDLRSDMEEISNLLLDGDTVISFEEGKAMADRLGATHYVEASARSNEGVLDVISAAISPLVEMLANPPCGDGDSAVDGLESPQQLSPKSFTHVPAEAVLDALSPAISTTHSTSKAPMTRRDTLIQKNGPTPVITSTVREKESRSPTSPNSKFAAKRSMEPIRSSPSIKSVVVVPPASPPLTRRAPSSVRKEPLPVTKQRSLAELSPRRSARTAVEQRQPLRQKSASPVSPHGSPSFSSPQSISRRASEAHLASPKRQPVTNKPSPPRLSPSAAGRLSHMQSMPTLQEHRATNEGDYAAAPRKQGLLRRLPSVMGLGGTERASISKQQVPTTPVPNPLAENTKKRSMLSSMFKQTKTDKRETAPIQKCTRHSHGAPQDASLTQSTASGPPSKTSVTAPTEKPKRVPVWERLTSGTKKKDAKPVITDKSNVRARKWT
ncbi:P-loop containing nucleoside triphosphate hydrolase protein [Phlyctochytrium arcticum]|nr:P-loop containing nucleoside triphosphate hydrolase protein [Phlyctochytrium arcticum]